MQGILEAEDIAEDYKMIEDKLATLESKKLNALDFQKDTFNPQHIMAERDIEIERLSVDNFYQSVLLKLWLMKTKEEKQELISKFIDNAVLIKNTDGSYGIQKVNFRNSFIEQLDKLDKQGVIDFPTTIINEDGKRENLRTSWNMNEQQLQDYMERLKQEMDADYIDLGEYYFHDDGFDKSYDNKSQIAKLTDKAIEFKIKRNQKLVRAVVLKKPQNFLAKPDLKFKMGIVTRKIEQK